MHRILSMLAGGDARSLGRADEVVATVIAHPALFEPLFEGLRCDDPLVAMRAADAVEKISARHPAWLRPHKAALIGPLARHPQKAVRWHVAQMLPRLSLSRTECRRALALLNAYLEDDSALVRTAAMQALAELAERSQELRATVLPRLERLTRAGTPAMRARGRKLLRRLGGR